MKKISLVLLISILFIFNSADAQNYEFKEVYLRNLQGNFDLIEKKGTVIILADKIELFDQVLYMKSRRFLLDEKGIKVGILYSCTDNTNWYSILITTENILYFKNKDFEMFRMKITENKI
jgi:hypothetical protein